MKALSALALTIGLVGSLASAAESWTVTELKIAQDAALGNFQADLGEESYNAIVGISVDRSIGGSAGRVKVTYKLGEEKKVVSYFCHVHEGTEIDCH